MDTEGRLTREHSSASGRRPGGRRRAPTALRRHKPREHDFVHDGTRCFWVRGLKATTSEKTTHKGAACVLLVKSLTKITCSDCWLSPLTRGSAVTSCYRRVFVCLVHWLLGPKGCQDLKTVRNACPRADESQPSGAVAVYAHPPNLIGNPPPPSLGSIS